MGMLANVNGKVRDARRRDTVAMWSCGHVAMPRHPNLSGVSCPPGSSNVAHTRTRDDPEWERRLCVTVILRACAGRPELSWVDIRTSHMRAIYPNSQLAQRTALGALPARIASSMTMAQ